METNAFDAGFAPVIAFSGFQSQSIQEACDVFVCPRFRHFSDEFDSGFLGGVAVGSDFVFVCPQRGMDSALPVDSHFDVSTHVVNIDDDFLDDGTQDSLFEIGGAGGMIPGFLKIPAETEQLFFLVGAWSGGRFGLGFEAGFCFGNFCERRVPPLLQFRSHESVGGIDRVVLTTGVPGFVANPVQGEFQRTTLLLVLRVDVFKGAERGFDAEGLAGFENQAGDGTLDFHSSEAEAGGAPLFFVSGLAVVSRSATVATTVAHMELVSALGAAEQSGQKCATVFRCPVDGLMGFGSVGCEDALVFHIPIPSDVAGMVVFEQDLPLVHREFVPAGLAGSACHRLGAYAGAAPGEGSRVGGIFHRTQEVLVVGELPVEMDCSMAVAGGGKHDVFLMMPEEDFTQGSETFELGEKSVDGLLDLTVRSDGNAGFPIADVADGHTGEDFPTHGFLSIGFLGALAKDAQFKLTHRSFETQKKAVVKMAGFVDSFIIDDDGFGQDTEVDEMVPVTVVTGETGGFEGEDRASFTVADGIEQAGKAGAFGATATGDSKVIVDDDDFLEAELLGSVLELILATAAFDVLPDLLEGGLADVNVGGTLQVCLGYFIVHDSVGWVEIFDSRTAWRRSSSSRLWQVSRASSGRRLTSSAFSKGRSPCAESAPKGSVVRFLWVGFIALITDSQLTHFKQAHQIKQGSGIDYRILLDANRRAQDLVKHPCWNATGCMVRKSHMNLITKAAHPSDDFKIGTMQRVELIPEFRIKAKVSSVG